MLHVVFGVPYPVAVGSGLLQVFLNSIVSAFNHWRAGNVNLRLGLMLAAGGLGGAEIGARILSLLGQGGVVWIGGRCFVLLDLLMNLLYLLLLGGVIFIILRETLRVSGDSGLEIAGLAKRLRQVTPGPLVSFPRSGIDRYSPAIPLLIGLSVGVLTGLMGFGGGFLNFPILIDLVGAPTPIAVGTSALQVLLPAASALYATPCWATWNRS